MGAKLCARIYCGSARSLKCWHIPSRVTLKPPRHCRNGNTLTGSSLRGCSNRRRRTSTRWWAPEWKYNPHMMDCGPTKCAAGRQLMFAITMSFSSAPAMVSGITSCTGGAVRDNKELNAMIASQTAMGRVGLPDDIGGAIALLLEAENSWVNAQRIEISGGMSL
jgi:Enoyl-(Acyl carrier protein) reductase